MAECFTREDKMFCPSCQHENPESSKFCNACGTKLASACPQCGHVNPPGSGFCNECGTPFTGKAKGKRQKAKGKTASSDSRRRTPDARPIDYTPKHLAEHIRAEQAAMEARGSVDGERKTITALFADIKGSMDLIEDLDPEDARRLFDPALQLMMEAVQRYERYVGQF